MRLSPLAIGPVLAGCALVAVTSCTTDEQQTEAGLAPSLTPAIAALSAYDIVKATAINVDGFQGDWTGIDSIMIADDPNNGRGALNNSAKVKLAWNDTYLFAMYDVSDTDLRAVQTARDADSLYRDDEVELYIDPQGNGVTASSMDTTDYHFLASLLEVVGDKRGTRTPSQDASYNAAGFLAKALTYGSVNGGGADTRYVVEMRIPWTDLGVTPAAGNFMRVDLAVGDRDGTPPTTDQYFDWANLGNNFNRPSGWKDVQLVVDATAPAAPTNPTLSVVSSSQINVSWTASSSSDVSRYRIFRGTTGTPTLVATVYDWPYQDTGLAAGTTYTYQIAAVDAGGNESPKTAQQSATAQSSGTGIRFGLWGLHFPLETSVPWTGIVRNSKSHSDVMSILASADSNHVGVWLGMAGGYGGYTTGTAFDLEKWKDSLDKSHAPQLNPDGTSGYYQDYLPYIQDGTFQGIVLLDDLKNWNPDVSFSQVEAMAAHSKLRFPALPTAVRERATELEVMAPACPSCPGGHSPYAKLDAAWAQYRSDRSPAPQFRDENIASAQHSKLGLLLGINIIHGDKSDSALAKDSLGGPVGATQLLDWGNAFLEPSTSDYICGFFMYDSTYIHKPSVYTSTARSNMNTLANKAASHVAAPCKRR
jgi:hypothetical protein